MSDSNGYKHNTIGSPQAEVLFEQDFIFIYQGLDEASCRAVVDLFERDDGKWRGRIGSSDSTLYQEDVKVSWELEIRNEGIWQEIFQRVHPQIEACMADYLLRSPILQSFTLQATGYRIQKYPKHQGYFRWHADAVGTHAGDRVVAMVLYLNDVEKGGETEFFHQGLKLSPRVGRLVLFPAGWNYMHCGHVPESNDKYIISTFIKVKPP